MRYEKNKVNPAAPSNEISIISKAGWEVNYDTALSGDVLLPEYASMIHIGGGGHLIVEDVNGDPHPYWGLLDGDWVPVVTNKVLYQATIEGQLRTTTVTYTTAHGGQ